LRTFETIGESFDASVGPGRLDARSARGVRAKGAAWFLPDLALVCALAAMISLFSGFGGATALFRDSDAGWHIRNGESILAHRALPVTDAFSFSKQGAPWIAWEWGADVLMGAVHRATGLDGVACLFGLGIGAAVWMWFRLNRAAGGSFALAAVFAAPMIATSSIHWLARPHVFGWLFLIAAVWWCEKAPARLTAGGACAIALASAAWANLHGSFLLGPAILLIYAAGAGLAIALWGVQRPVAPYLYLQAALAAVLGSFLNPYGWRLHRHVLAYLTDSALLRRVGEFQSFDFHAAGAGWVIAALCIGLVGGAAALSIRRPERFVVAVAMTAAALVSARSLPLAAMALLPLANGSITEVLSLAGGLRPRLRRHLDRALIYSEKLGVFDSKRNGFALVPLAAVLLFAVMRGHAAFPADQIPVAAAERIASLPADARIFSTDKFGGYLIYRFSAGRLVFFDGRSDFYGVNFIDGYARMFEARPAWRQEFERWNFTHALLPPDAPLAAALEGSGWHELYRDRTAVLLAPTVQSPVQGYAPVRRVVRGLKNAPDRRMSIGPQAHRDRRGNHAAVEGS